MGDNETFYETENDSLASGAPPEFQTSDYGEIALLAILITVGGPLNLISLYRTLLAAGYFGFFQPQPKFSLSSQSQSLRRRQTPSSHNNVEALLHHRQGAKQKNPRLLTFKLHLTCANLLIVFGYGFSQLIWLCTYSWLGGDILCKFTKFLHTFCFYATSNLVASIAIDRLHVTINVDRPSSHVVTRRASKSASLASSQAHAVWLRRLTWSAWILAVASSTPQFFLWRTFTPFAEHNSWTQCVTVWMAALSADSSGNAPVWTLNEVVYYEKIYGAVHVTLVFWIPVIVIVLCYALILAQLHNRIMRSNRDLRHLCKYRRESDGVVFRQRCETMHRASICSAGSTQISGGKDSGPTTIQELQPSAALLMELPIVISSAQPFICQPLSESFAVVTLTKAKKTTMKKTAWILLAYVACWSPYNILELYRFLIDPTFENVYLQFLSNLIIFNAVVNPVIYGL